MAVISDILLGIVTNLLSATLSAARDRRAVENLLRAPVARLRESALALCRSESVGDADCERLLNMAGKCIRDARLRLSDFESEHYDVRHVWSRLTSRRKYAQAHDGMSEPETQLFERLCRAVLELICHELPLIEAQHKVIQVRVAQEAHEHHQESARDHALVLKTLSEVRDAQVPVNDLIRPLRRQLQRQVHELDDLVRSEKLRHADAKAQALSEALSSDFAAVPQEDRADALSAIAGYYASAGDTERAQDIASDAECVSPDRPRTKLVSAKILAIRGKHEEALSRLEGLDHENARILRFAIGCEIGNADASGLTALESSSTPQASSALASYYMRTGQLSLAEKYARKAVKKSPTSHNHWMLGNVLTGQVIADRYGSPDALFHPATFVPSSEERSRLHEACGHLRDAVSAARTNLPEADDRTKEREHHLMQCLALFDEPKAVELAVELLEREPADLQAAQYLLYTGHPERTSGVLEHIDLSAMEDEAAAYTIASILIESGHPDSALEMLRGWREANPVADDYRWTQLAGHAYRLLGDVEEAAKITECFAAAHGRNEQYDKLLASHLAETGDRVGAERAVDRILATRRDEGNLLFVSATLQGVSAPSKLAEYLRELTELSPKREFYYQFVTCCFQAQDYQGVLQAVKVARDRGMLDTAMDKAEGTALYYMGSIADARPILRRAYEAQKQARWIEQGLGVNLAACEMLLSNEDSSLNVLAELVEQPDVIPDAYRMLVNYYSQIGRHERAYDYAKQAADVFPDDESARSGEVFCAMACGRTREAVSAMQRFVAEFPESHVVWQATPEDGLECLRSSRDRQEKIWELYQRGDTPRVFHTDFSRFALASDWVRATDGGDHSAVSEHPPTYVAPSTDQIAAAYSEDLSTTGAVLDYTSLLTLQSLDLLEAVVGAVGKVYYPPQLLVALLEEIRRVSSLSPERDERSSIIDGLVNSRAIVVQDELQDWDVLSKLLEERYLSEQIGVLTAIRLWYADEVGAYYLDDHLLDNPYMKVTGGWPEYISNNVVSIADLVQHLWEKGKLSGVLKQSVTEQLQQYGGTSNARPPRSPGDWQDGRSLVVNLTALETMCELGVLHDMVAEYRGRIWLPRHDYDELRGRLIEVQTNMIAKPRIEAIQRVVTKCPGMIPLSIAPTDRSFTIEDAEDHHYLQLMTQAVSLAIYKGVPLIADDRAMTRLNADGLVTASTPQLLGDLCDRGAITSEQYEESYLRLLEWNCLFIPLDANVLADILSRSPIRSKDASTVSRYYRSAFQDPGLSRTPYTADSPQSDALRFYSSYAATLVSVLALIWANDSLSTQHKIEASGFIRSEMWQEPKVVLATAHVERDAETARMLWHVRLVEIMGGATESLPDSFAGWYYSTWLKPDIDCSTLGISRPSVKRIVSGSDIIAWAKAVIPDLFSAYTA